MSSDTPIEFTYRAKLDKFASDLAKASGIQEAEARKLVASMDKGVRSLERNSAKAARAAEQAAKKAAAEWTARLGDIKQGSEKVFGGIVGDLTDVGKGLMALGPQGALVASSMAAVAVGALAFGLVTKAAFDLSVGLVDADKKLENLYQRGVPGFTRASDEALAASRALNASFVVLGQTSTQLSVTVGNEFAPAFASASDDVVAMTLIANDATKAFFDSTYAMEWIRTTAENVFPATTTLIDLWGLSTTEYREQAEKMIQTEVDKAKITEINTGLQKIAIEKTKEKTKAEQEAEAAERAREKALREQEAAQRKAVAAAEKRAQTEQQLHDTLNGLFTEFLTPLQKIDEKYDDIADGVKKLGGSESDLAEVEMARALAKQKLMEEEDAKAAELADKAKKRREADAKEAADLAKKQAEQQDALYLKALERIENERAARLAAFAEYAALGDQALGLVSQLADREFAKQTETIDGLREARDKARKNRDAEEVKSLDAQIREHKKAAMKAFFIDRAVAVSQIALATAVAVAQAAPNLVLMGVIGALGVASGVMAASEPAPSLYRGGRMDPDAMMVEGHRGEGVANARLMRNDGDAIDEGNQTGRLPRATGSSGGFGTIDGRSLSGLLGYAARQTGAFRDLLQEGQPMPGVSRRTY